MIKKVVDITTISRDRDKEVQKTCKEDGLIVEQTTFYNGKHGDDRRITKIVVDQYIEETPKIRAKSIAPATTNARQDITTMDYDDDGNLVTYRLINDGIVTKKLEWDNDHNVNTSDFYDITGRLNQKIVETFNGEGDNKRIQNIKTEIYQYNDEESRDMITGSEIGIETYEYDKDGTVTIHRYKDDTLTGAECYKTFDSIEIPEIDGVTLDQNWFKVKDLAEYQVTYNRQTGDITGIKTFVYVTKEEDHVEVIRASKAIIKSNSSMNDFDEVVKATKDIKINDSNILFKLDMTSARKSTLVENEVLYTSYDYTNGITMNKVISYGINKALENATEENVVEVLRKEFKEYIEFAEVSTVLNSDTRSAQIYTHRSSVKTMEGYGLVGYGFTYIATDNGITTNYQYANTIGEESKASIGKYIEVGDNGYYTKSVSLSDGSTYLVNQHINDTEIAATLTSDKSELMDLFNTDRATMMEDYRQDMIGRIEYILATEILLKDTTIEKSILQMVTSTLQED